MSPGRRTGLLLAAGGCVPFAAGAALPADDLPAIWCPFREATGLPCPLCGATRAFILAGHGDGDFTQYGAGWVVVAALAVIAGLAGLAGRARPRIRAHPLLVVALVAAGPWAWALAHRDTIVT